MKRNKFLGFVAFAAAFTIGLAGQAFAAGWTQDESGWKWQLSDGTFLSSTWQWTDGDKDGIAEYYYFGSDGYLLTNAITPDANQVNGEGAWVIDNKVQTLEISLNQSIEPYRKYLGTYHYYMEEYSEDDEAPAVEEDFTKKLQLVEDDGTLYLVTDFSYNAYSQTMIRKRIPLNIDSFNRGVFNAQLNPEYWATYYAYPEENAYGHRGLFLAETFELFEFWYIKE